MTYTVSDICDEIIDNVRTYVVAGSENILLCDSWDEGKNGVAWLDNEFDLFNTLYAGDKIDLFGVSTVEEVKSILQKKTMNHLTLLKKFTLRGGTNHMKFFELIEPNNSGEPSNIPLLSYLMDQTENTDCVA